MNLENICTTTIEVAKSTGAFIKDQLKNISSGNIEKKGENDYVTYVDKTAEQKIVEQLEKLVPEAGFILEEGETNKKEIFNWVIDPLDGTTNYIHGVYPYAVSIALMKGDEVIVGVIYEISMDECFYAWKDGGAYLNNQQISVSNAKTVKNSMISVGFPYYDELRIKGLMDSVEYLINNSHGVRRLGSAATDLAYVACGRFDAFYEYDLQPWDVSAGALIVQEAGGKVSDFKGGNTHLSGKEMIASNKLIYNEFFNIIKSKIK